MRHLYLTLLLVMAGGLSNGWSQATICFLNPWAEDPDWADLPPYIRSADGGNWFPGVEMTHTEGDWWCHTFSAPAPLFQSYAFLFAMGTPPNFFDEQWFVPGSGIVTTEPSQDTWFSQSQIEQQYGQNATVYIFMDGTGVVVTDILPGSKPVFILNPWTVSAPTISLNGGEYEGMRLSDHCEWFVYYVNGDSTYDVHFREIFGNSVYGAAGGTDPTPIDLNVHFSQYDSAFIYPSPAPDGAPIISETFPGFEGTCGFNLAATVRDFSETHPDFMEAGTIAGGSVQEGMVDVNLGADGKPRIGPTPHQYQSRFDEWFTTVDGVNAETCVDIPMTKTQGGLWEYDSYNEPSKGFFPIDDFAEIGASERSPSTYKVRGFPQWVEDPTGALHNFHFCLEMHTHFVYKPAASGQVGQTISVEGDDDVWVFINNQLVIDLGGVRPAVADTLILDDMALALGWNAGDTLPLDLFMCDRSPNSSSMWIRTSIYFEQGGRSWIDTVLIGPTTVRYDVWRRIGADGSCASVGSGVDTLPETADYELTGTGINGSRDLSINPVEGITIGSGLTNITIDTSAIRTANDLAPGSYVLTIRTQNEPQREFRIPITVFGQVESVQSRLQSVFNIGFNPSNQLTFQLKNQAVLEFELYGTNGKLFWKQPRKSFKAGTNVVPLSPSAVGENIRLLRISSEGETYTKLLAPVGP